MAGSKDVFRGAKGTPVADGNSTDPLFPVAFDNTGKNADLGATEGAFFSQRRTNPTEVTVTSVGTGAPINVDN